MSSEEHLVENIIYYVEDKGWNKFPDFITKEEVTDEMRNIPCAEQVNDETLAWLITMARYVAYERAIWGD